MKLNHIARTAALPLALALALTACGGSPGDEAPATEPETSADGDALDRAIDTSLVKSAITVGVDNPHYRFHQDVFMAEVLGYFEEVGIDEVTIISTSDPLPALIG